MQQQKRRNKKGKNAGNINLLKVWYMKYALIWCDYCKKYGNEINYYTTPHVSACVLVHLSSSYSTVADAASSWIDCKSHTQPARSSLSCLSPIKQTSLFFYSTSSLKRWFCSHQQHRCPLSGQTLCCGGAQALLSEQPAAGYGGWMMQRNGNEWCRDFLLHGFHLFFILIKINQRWTRFFFACVHHQQSLLE